MDLDRALAFSRYAERALTAHPALRDEIVATIDARFDWPDALRDVDAAVAADDPAILAAVLRVLRRRAFMHTLARDLTGRADFAEVVHAMTTLAERSLAAAVELHTRSLAATFGLPRGDAGDDVQQLIVVGMGKLGGCELNVSSDIDLVFV
jgi:glutamate-ammonia-ligase adenylyltransferase